MTIFEGAIGAAVLLDLLLGDPRWLPHPVRLIGLFCGWSEWCLRRIVASEYLAGGLTVCSVLVLTLGLSGGLLFVADSVAHVLYLVVVIYLLYTTLAARGLVTHSMAVYHALQDQQSLEGARTAVAQIVGRDTASLDRCGIIRACIETVAENMVDGVTAPLFYAVVLSLLAPVSGLDPLALALLGAMGYKAVNTMDSMFGYKNERYLCFGRTAARLDDLVNWVPARISGMILIPTALLLGLDWKNSLKIFRRDRLCHASPNAAHGEAAVAGALGVRLGGNAIYFGKELEKEAIGDALRPVQDLDILASNRMMLLGSFVFLITLLFLRIVLLGIFL